MTVPVLLVTGFLGAGKTTAINRLLSADHGQRIAAVVNDFGAINIDEGLLAGSADTVVGLKNGCICCSMQGDLLRTLRLLLDLPAPPERIVIEASGAADPRGIIESLTDPVLWNSVRLDTVVCLVDAQSLVDEPARMQDALWLAQWQHSDFILLSKAGAEAEPPEAARALFSIARKPVFDLAEEGLPVELMLGPSTSTPRAPLSPGRVGAEQFVSIEWQSDGPLSLARLREVLGQISPGLLRAKGTFEAMERPGQPHLLQIVGRRVTFSLAPDTVSGCQLVFIGRRGLFQPDRALALLDGLAAVSPLSERTLP